MCVMRRKVIPQDIFMYLMFLRGGVILNKNYRFEVDNPFPKNLLRLPFCLTKHCD